LCVWRDNEQLFTNETALGTVVQIVENGLLWFGKRSFNAVNIQRPNRVGGPFFVPPSSSPIEKT